MNTIIKILIVVAVIAFCLTITKVGIARQEKVNCNKLQKYATEYNDFYITKIQNETCFNHGIQIDAVVK